MNTQPVPTFPMVAGFEKYFGLTPLELVDTYLSNSPDIQKMSKHFEPVVEDFFKSPEHKAEYYSITSPYLKDFFVELVKIEKNPEAYTMYQRLSARDIMYSIYEKTSP